MRAIATKMNETFAIGNVYLFVQGKKEDSSKSGGIYTFLFFFSQNITQLNSYNWNLQVFNYIDIWSEHQPTDNDDVLAAYIMGG